MSLIRNRGFALVLAVVAATFVTLFAVSDARAGTFSPTLIVEVENKEPEQPSAFTVDFGLPDGDVNFAGVVSFIPGDWGITTGDKFPIGTVVGNLTAQATLGLINAPCNTALPVEFEFQNASIDTTDTVPWEDVDNDGTGDYANDVDGNGIFDAIDKYPDFLPRLFPGLQPIRRSAGISPVAGIPILLQFLIFPPGTEVNENIPSDAELGFPSVTVLQNAGDPDAIPAPGPITDFCTPLATTNVTLGETDDGTPLYTNPQAGDYTFTTIAVGQRDADNDSYENSLDTCALIANVGNPRIGQDGDIDGDGLDAACDPNDDSATGGTNSDEDADGYINRQDNCPLDPNGEQEDNQEDADLDQIGDACDPDSAVENGDLSFQQPEVPITIGAGGAGGPPTSCDVCWTEDWVFEGPTPAASPGGAETPSGGSPSVTAAPSGDDDGGSNTGVVVGVVVAVIAGIVIIGGGAALMMRRRSGT